MFIFLKIIFITLKHETNFCNVLLFVERDILYCNINVSCKERDSFQLLSHIHVFYMWVYVFDYVCVYVCMLCIYTYINVYTVLSVNDYTRFLLD